MKPRRNHRNHRAAIKPAEQTKVPEAVVAPAPMRRKEWLLLALLTAAGGVLFLANLGDQYLWQDEAQTALIAQTVLDGGIPRGYDGKNYFSQELGLEYKAESNYVYRWHTWFPFYLLAGFFGTLGANTWTARLPFALVGLACVPLSYCFARSLWRSRRAAVLAAVLLGTSVPFLLLSRQCRYYSPCALFSLLGLLAYYHLVRRKRWAGAVFVVAAVLLFQCQVPYWAVLLAAVWTHAAVFHRDRLLAVTLWSLATFLLNLPWLVWLLSPPAVGRYPNAIYSVQGSLVAAQEYFFATFRHLFSPILLVVLVATVIAIARRTQRVPKPERETLEGVALLLMFVIVNLVALSILSPYYFFRYLTPAIPPLCLLAALVLDFAMRWHWSVGIVGFAAVVFFSPMRDYLYEVTHHYTSPTEGIVRYLNEHAKPDDVVAITALSVRGPELRSNLRVVTVAWMYGIVWWICCVDGSHIYKFCRGIGFNNFHFGVMAAIPCLATLSQLIAAIIIERTGLRKHQFMHTSIIYRLLWVPIGLLPLLMFVPSGVAERLADVPYTGPTPPVVLVVLGLLAGAWLLESFSRPAWMTWMSDLIPRRIRGRYFAMRTRRSQVVCIFAVTAVSLVMIYNAECWSFLNTRLGLGLSTDRESLARLYLYTVSGIFLLGAVFGTIDIALFSRIRELMPSHSGRSAPPASSEPSILSVLIDPLRDRVFRHYAAYGFALAFSVSSAYYYFLFSLERLGFNQLATNLLFLVIAPLLSIMTSGAWGRLIDRWGRRPVLIVATLLTAVSALPWFFMTPTTHHPHFVEAGANWLGGQIGSIFGRPDWKWVTPGVPVGAYLLGCLSCAIGGASWSGVNLAQSNVMFALGDKAGRSKSIAAASVLISVGGLLGGVAGGAIAEWLKDMPPLTQFLWGNFHVCFLVSIIVRVAGIGWLWGMPDPGSAPVRVLLGHMRANLFSTLQSWFSYPVRILGWGRDSEDDGK